MDSTEENNNKKSSVATKVNGPSDQKESGNNKIVMQTFLEDYAYCVVDDTVDGMHHAQGKPHHAYQMNI